MALEGLARALKAHLAIPARRLLILCPNHSRRWAMRRAARPAASSLAPYPVNEHSKSSQVGWSSLFQDMLGYSCLRCARRPQFLRHSLGSTRGSMRLIIRVLETDRICYAIDSMCIVRCISFIGAFISSSKPWLTRRTSTRAPACRTAPCTAPPAPPRSASRARHRSAGPCETSRAPPWGRPCSPRANRPSRSPKTSRQPASMRGRGRRAAAVAQQASCQCRHRLRRRLVAPSRAAGVPSRRHRRGRAAARRPRPVRRPRPSQPWGWGACSGRTATGAAVPAARPSGQPHHSRTLDSRATTVGGNAYLCPDRTSMTDQDGPGPRPGLCILNNQCDSLRRKQRTERGPHPRRACEAFLVDFHAGPARPAMQAAAVLA